VPQPKKKAQASAKEQKILDGWIRQDFSRPYYMAIRAAFIERFVQWYKIDISSDEIEAASEKKRLEQEWTELARLLSPYPPTSGRHDWRELPTEPQIVRVLRHVWRLAADRKPRGRPPSQLRRLAVQALDLQRIDRERWKWRALTKHLCNCGSMEHSPKCQKNFKREALLLKQSLRTLGVKLPPPLRNNR
jgi:hypothetical protein